MTVAFTQAQPLSSFPPQHSARIVSVQMDHDDALRLKALGLCVGRRVELVQSGDPLIVSVLGARVGLAARLAAGIYVEADE
jgi:Fe2+ transport system protein FeoA